MKKWRVCEEGEEYNEKTGTKRERKKDKNPSYKKKNRANNI